MAVAVPKAMTTMMRSSVVIMMIVLVVMIVTIVMLFLVVIMVVHMMIVVSVAVPMTSLHFLQEADGIQKGDAKAKEDELGQSKFQRGFFVQDVRQNVDGCQIHKATRRN